MILDGETNFVEIVFYLLHFGIDSISELLELLPPLFGLLMHFFFEYEGLFHFVEEHLFFHELVIFALPFLLLILKELSLGHVGGHFLLESDELVLLPTSAESYMMMVTDSSSISLFFFSRVLERFSNYFCLLFIT